MPVKKRNTKGIVNLRGGVSVVHLNVSSGYLAYVAAEKGDTPRVHSVVLRRQEPRDE
ncbi:MAG TPA: hypothetical protein VJ397_08710 [Thermoplasmata archaeon]|nr:hypothetical protein [Thermoplasmata archaeon]